MSHFNYKDGKIVDDWTLYETGQLHRLPALLVQRGDLHAGTNRLHWEDRHPCGGDRREPMPRSQ